MAFSPVLFTVSCLLCLNICVFAQLPVDQAFRRSKIVPDIIDQPPFDLAEVRYRKWHRIVNLGNELEPNQTRDTPEVHYPPYSGYYYTLMLLDIDVPRRKNPSLRSFVNWLVVNIFESDLSTGDVIMEYVGIAPLKFSDKQRFVFLVFEQEHFQNFNETRYDTTAVGGRSSFSVRRFVDKYNLGDAVAGNYFVAEYDESVPILFRQFKT